MPGRRRMRQYVALRLRELVAFSIDELKIFQDPVIDPAFGCRARPWRLLSGRRVREGADSSCVVDVRRSVTPCDRTSYAIAADGAVVPPAPSSRLVPAVLISVSGLDRSEGVAKDGEESTISGRVGKGLALNEANASVIPEIPDDQSRNTHRRRDPPSCSCSGASSRCDDRWIRGSSRSRPGVAAPRVLPPGLPRGLIATQD